MYGYIYKTTNLINNKFYIGQHKASTFDKKYYGSGVIILNAIKKYGKENFTCEIIESCESASDLNDREIYWIQYYSATNSDIAYNIKYGGSSSEMPEQVKLKISKALQNVKKSDVARENMRQAKLGTSHDSWNKKKVWVHNDIEELMVFPSELDGYLINNYQRGRLKKSINYSELYANRIFINNGKNEKQIKSDYLLEYLANGWVEGRLASAYSENRNKNISKAKKGKIAVKKDDKIKYINVEDLVEYLSNGYIKYKK